MNNKIKWASIQPLTGGMYLGAEEAIGHPAEWILTYDGLDDVKYDKSGNIINAANEYNLVKYLTDKNRMVKYYKIRNKGMFDDNITEKNPNIYLNDNLETPDYTNLDLVVAVPVCSGLSIVTSGSMETRNGRNNNMLWLAYYVMNVIQPKCYIFENAPTLMGVRGDEIRIKLETIAQNAGYSVLYYKTDTKYHFNCQQRPRTFVCFFKINDISGEEIKFDYTNNHINVIDFFSNMNKNASQQIEVPTPYHNYILLDYVKEKFGKDWQKHVYNSLMKFIEKKFSLTDFIDYIKEYNCEDYHKERAIKYVEHIIYKHSLNLNYYDTDACLFNRDTFPSVQFRSMQYMLHPIEERFCTVREYLTLMGHPDDFILYGNPSNYAKIGQNVPVKTAKFIVEQALNNLNKQNNKFEIKIQDNIKFNKN
jgi:site-specific DNA-cytosine methylase